MAGAVACHSPTRSRIGEFHLAEMGAGHIIHSEDFPYVVRDNVSEFLEQADLTEDERSAIAYRNAEKLVRI
jgi:uncharacterized protein